MVWSDINHEFFCAATDLVSCSVSAGVPVLRALLLLLQVSYALPVA